MPATRWSITLPPDIAEQIESRSPGDRDRSGAIAHSLDRYFFLLGQARRRLAEQFSESEISLILDALNGTMWLEPLVFQVAWGEVSDAIRLSGLAGKWDVDDRALVKRLRQLSLTETAALVDASERWWARG